MGDKIFSYLYRISETSMNTPNTNENENLKKIASQVPYKYETEHTHMEFIFIWAAANTPAGDDPVYYT